MILVGESALHVKPYATFAATCGRFCKQLVKGIGCSVWAALRGIRSGFRRGVGGHRKSGVQLISASPDFARHKTTRLAEHFSMIIIENMRLSLNLKFSKGQ